MQETTGARTITVRCPTHNIDVVAEGERIVCPQGPHGLAQGFPTEAFWEYCCDCQRFWPSELNHGGQGESQCPVCGRQIARRYLCDECKVVSVESDDLKVRGKRYSFTEQGVVSPECPACSGVPTGTMNRHDCEDAGTKFTTRRDVCPFCEKPTKIEEKIEKRIETPPRATPRVKKAPVVNASSAVAVDTSTTGQTKTPTCPHCGNTNKPNELFCGKCGGLLNGSIDLLGRPASQAVEESVQPPSSVAPSTAKTNYLPLKLILGGIAGIVLLGILLTLASLSAGGNSVEKKLDVAIARRNLFGPSGDNAYSLYYELKKSGANEETLKRYREKLTPLLTQHGYQLTTDILILGYDEPDASEWQDAGKSLDWAVELNPGNSYMSARAAYCDGRAAFIQKQSDQALTMWTKAASLDKSWALPVNGIGLIYNSRRDYSSARSYFSEAIRREPNWAVPYENMGNAYYMEKNRDYARQFYNRALEKAPTWAKPHVHLADMALEDKDYPTAISEFEAALSSNAKGLKGQELTKVQERLEIARTHLSGG